MAPVSVTFTYAPREYRRLVRRATSLRPSFQCTTTLAWLSLVAGLYLLVVTSSRVTGDVLVGLAAAVFLCVVLGLWLGPLVAWRFARRLRDPWTVEISEHGLRSVSEDRATELAWSAVRHEPLEGEGFVCFLLQGRLPSRGVLIPKRALGSPDELVWIRRTALAHGKVFAGLAVRG
jgi:hypothetical protein